MLVHQLPPDPPALRVRIWRRLQGLGALQLKSSVYLLPAGEGSLEDFEWLVEEIRGGGGDATLWRATIAEGATDAEIVAQFQSAVAAEYEELGRDARSLAESGEREPERRRALGRLTKRFDDIGARDHFGAPGREVVGAVLDALRSAVDRTAPVATNADEERTAMHEYTAMTWVTRADVKIDRLASAWLIRRFIDPRARFAFTREKRHARKEGEVRFDMYDGEFTHEGDLCTFEVLLRRFGLKDSGLERLGEIVHDIDLKEERYAHAETAGVAALVSGLASSIPDDEARIDAASPLLDGLLEQLRRAPVRA
jgi:hypothetical protein